MEASPSSAILLVGNPNSGKSFLFNRLSGLTQKVANFPGVTVSIRSGECAGFTLFDYPGLYSLDPLTVDERVAVQGFRKAILNPMTRAIVYVADATRLERSMLLFLQILPLARAHGVPILGAVNIIDEVIGRGAKLDTEGLSKELGIPFFAVSAKTEEGVPALRAAIESTLQGAKAIVKAPLLEVAIPPVEELRDVARGLSKKYGPPLGVMIRSQEKLDHFFLSGAWGFLIFGLMMFFLFQSIFTVAAPIMDGVSEIISWLGAKVVSILPAGIIADFVKDAVFEGMASVLVFVPQIFILTFIIGLLEDSGYLARAAVICHRPLSFFGLSGKSFVPLLSGHACAIPAIMSARTIESPRKRLITQMILPLMTCSARLPVYGLLVAAVIPRTSYLGGVISLQGLVFFGLYLLGICSGLAVAAFLQRTLPASTEDSPFIVELPPYRFPGLRTISKDSFSRMLGFVTRAGWVIFSVVVGVWFLGYFPNGGGHLDQSYLGKLGHLIEPIFKPMGMDWKIGVAVLTSFLAREVFVGTLGTLYGLENAKDDPTLLIENLHRSGLSLASALGLMVFFTIALQCVSTLTVLKTETGKRWLPPTLFLGYFIAAYTAASVAFRLAQLF